MANLILNNRYSNVFVSIINRRLSSYNNHTKSGIISIVPNDDFNNIWSESNWSHFGKQFNSYKRFPLPGQIGISGENKSNSNEIKEKIINKYNLNLLKENLTYLLQEPLNEEIQVIKMTEASESLKYKQETEKFSMIKSIIELKTYDCPLSLLNDFQSYFRLNSIAEGSLSVITVSFKTENDMATWNNQVDVEREQLTEKFVDKAQQICQLFEREGFWADFIDPSTGSLHKSPYTHATFYETDERYRHLGFEIIDHGCCKVVSHHVWGTKTYIGCVLTNATNENLKDIVKKSETI